MGSAHTSHTNLGKDSTSFSSSTTGTKARWGDFELSMGNWKENNDLTQVWGVKYKPSHHEKDSCGFQLKASHNNNSLESVYFELKDSSPNNEIKFSLKITRVACDQGLSGGIIGVVSSSGVAPLSFTRTIKESSISIETTIISNGCSLRDGLFVLEMKKKVNSKNAYMFTLAHYYVVKDIGLSVIAKIHRDKNGFGVKIEGPFKHPASDLHRVIVETCRSGVWSPNACSHCNKNGAKASEGIKNGVSNDSSLVKANESNHEGEEAIIGEVVKGGVFSSHVREQYNKGLINSSGYTSGSLNNSIIFMNCHF